MYIYIIYIVYLQPEVHYEHSTKRDLLVFSHLNLKVYTDNFEGFQWKFCK